MEDFYFFIVASVVFLFNNGSFYVVVQKDRKSESVCFKTLFKMFHSKDFFFVLMKVKNSAMAVLSEEGRVIPRKKQVHLVRMIAPCRGSWSGYGEAVALWVGIDLQRLRKKTRLTNYLILQVRGLRR